MDFFVSRFSKLYGDKNLRFKLHLQLHLLKQVKDFGPLHRYSWFPFEGYFAIMKKFLHGTRGFVNQLHSSSSIGLSIAKIPDILSEKLETEDAHELNFILKLNEFHSFVTRKNNVAFNMSFTDPNHIHKTILENLNINCKTIKTNRRIVIDNKGM